jgi:hypothetical protein
VVPGHELSGLAATIRNDLVSDGHFPSVEPKTYSLLDRLEYPGSSTRETARRTGYDRATEFTSEDGRAEPLRHTNEVLNIRQGLSNIARNEKGNSEGIAASRALKHVEDYLESVDGRYGQTMRDAGFNWRQAAFATELEQAVQRAQTRAKMVKGNVGDQLRSEMFSILEDKTIPKTKEVSDALRAIVEGGGTPQMLAHLGNSHGVWWTIWSLLHGHPVTAAAAFGPGWLARQADRQRTTGWIDALRDRTLRQAPASAGVPPAQPLPSRAWSALPPALRSLDALNSTDDALQ